MTLYLIGYMYSGKTTLGRQLAERLGYNFLDLDVAFEERYRVSIPHFFEKYGEPAFRQLEKQLLHQTATLDNTVISTGGGTPCIDDNMDFINHAGVSVYLELTADAICTRAARSKKPRPILTGLSEEERCEKIALQLCQRKPYYEQAHLTVNTYAPTLEDFAPILDDLMPRLALLGVMPLSK